MRSPTPHIRELLDRLTLDDLWKEQIGRRFGRRPTPTEASPSTWTIAKKWECRRLNAPIASMLPLCSTLSVL